MRAGNRTCGPSSTPKHTPPLEPARNACTLAKLKGREGEGDAVRYSSIAEEDCGAKPNKCGAGGLCDPGEVRREPGSAILMECRAGIGGPGGLGSRICTFSHPSQFNLNTQKLLFPQTDKVYAVRGKKMPELNTNDNFYNEDCISGCPKHIKDNSVDLIITDPPYGIEGDKLHRHYNRDEDFVVDGYVEIPAEKYNEFSHKWIKEAERILKPNGQIYIVSGYTNLYDILDALKATKLNEINHIIWKYNFGVYTKTKYISSHYHILYYEKPGPGKRGFNRDCRYGPQEKDDNGGSLNYQDREDVWIINREYKPGKEKNKNELPLALLTKMIQYSSSEGDLVCDLFLGGFSTAKVAIGLNRRATGFEISDKIFNKKIGEIKDIKPGYLLHTLRKPKGDAWENQGKSWTDEEKEKLLFRFNNLMKKNNKSATIKILSKEFGRGHWSIEKLLKKNNIKITGTSSNSTLMDFSTG